MQFSRSKAMDCANNPLSLKELWMDRLLSLPLCSSVHIDQTFVPLLFSFLKASLQLFDCHVGRKLQNQKGWWSTWNWTLSFDVNPTCLGTLWNTVHSGYKRGRNCNWNENGLDWGIQSCWSVFLFYGRLSFFNTVILMVKRFWVACKGVELHLKMTHLICLNIDFFQNFALHCIFHWNCHWFKTLNLSFSHNFVLFKLRGTFQYLFFKFVCWIISLL